MADLGQIKSDLVILRRRVGIAIADTEGSDRTAYIAEVKAMVHKIDVMLYHAQKRDESPSPVAR